MGEDEDDLRPCGCKCEVFFFIENFHDEKLCVDETIRGQAGNVFKRELIEGMKVVGKAPRTRKSLTHRIVEKEEDSDPIILDPHRETSLLNFEI